MVDDVPTAEDYASIDRASVELVRRGWREKLSVHEVIDQWGDLVTIVEEGYGLSIDEFTNDVSLRRWAAEASPLLTPLVRDAMNARLTPLDDRFRAATFEVHRALPGAETGYWWDQRLPVRLVGELAEDVRRMGLGPVAP